ncbi:MAG: hypothetical protein KDC95_04970 [Planctomycetes bacterium]|nr:hypothetical protein [Planctomycetota bacterium]
MMKQRTWMSSLALAVLTGASVAQTRHVVGGNVGEFRTIQAAVDAATSGDQIFVRAGTYGSFDVVGKSLRIIGGGGGAVPSVRVSGLSVVRAVQTGTVLLSRMEMSGLAIRQSNADIVLSLLGTGDGGLEITSCRDVRASDIRTGANPLTVADSRLTLVASSLADGLSATGLKGPAAIFDRSHVVFGGVNANGLATHPTVRLTKTILELFNDGFSAIKNSGQTTPCIAGDTASNVVVDTDSSFGFGRDANNAINGVPWTMRPAGIVGAGPADLGSEMLVLFGKDTSDSWVLLFGTQGPYVDLGFGGTDLGLGTIVGVLSGGPGTNRLAFRFQVPNIQALAGVHLTWQGATIHSAGLTLTNVSTNVIQG